MMDTIEFHKYLGENNKVVETHSVEAKDISAGIIWTSDGCFVKNSINQEEKDFINKRIKKDTKNYINNRGEHSVDEKTIGSGYEGEKGCFLFFSKHMNISCSPPSITIRPAINDPDLILEGKVAINVKCQPYHNKYPYGVSHLYNTGNCSLESFEKYSKKYSEYSNFWMFTGIWKDSQGEEWVKIYGFLPYMDLHKYIEEPYTGNPNKKGTYMDIPDTCKKLKDIPKSNQIYTNYPPKVLFFQNLELITGLVKDFYV
tara:strand:- start:2558 stop:3328 length:771 start_codon:yes stop_codon:yes gene_type:complete